MNLNNRLRNPWSLSLALFPQRRYKVVAHAMTDQNLVTKTLRRSSSISRGVHHHDDDEVTNRSLRAAFSATPYIGMMDVAPNSDSFPRPQGAQPGELAPWAHLSERDRTSLNLEVVLERILAVEVPDHPDPLPWAEGEDFTNLAEALAAHSLRDAAVLVAFYDVAGAVHVVLTRRSEHLRSHSGQISFPGGRIDPGEHAIDAALREAQEEVGLNPELVEVLGTGQRVAIMGGGSMVHPVFARLREPPALLASPDEVTEIFQVPLSALLAPGAYREDRWPGGGMGSWMPDNSVFRICFLTFDERNTVWGVTGWMLRGYLCDALGIPR